MLTEMERKELIAMTADPSDGRAQIVNFSARSRGIRDDAMKILGTIEGRLADQLGKKRFEALTEALARDWGPPAYVDK
jgi:DNA-binding MarR family transcriptional regulator